MTKLRFEWDECKNRSNKHEHRVSFEEARTVFSDENAVEYHDLDHSDQEDRFIMLGISSKSRALVVCYCYREDETVIRIISARKARQEEETEYGRYIK